MKTNPLKSETTVTALAGNGGVAGLIMLIMRLAGLEADPEAIAILTAILGPLVARLIAYLRGQ